MTSRSAGDPSDPLIFVVSGPSGSGKTSLCAQALKDFSWIRPSISHTTRTPRKGETNGEDYFFVDRSGFMDKVRRGEFLEWAEVHGQLYGTSVENLDPVTGDQALLFEVDCKGARQIQQHLPRAVLIFIMTPSFEDLVARIRHRGRMSREELAVRIHTACEELRQVHAFGYVVVNDEFSEASRSFQSILRSGRFLRERVLPGRINRWEEEIRRYDPPPSSG